MSVQLHTGGVTVHQDTRRHVCCGPISAGISPPDVPKNVVGHVTTPKRPARSRSVPTCSAPFCAPTVFEFALKPKPAHFPPGPPHSPRNQDIPALRYPQGRALAVRRPFPRENLHLNLAPSAIDFWRPFPRSYRSNLQPPTSSCLFLYSMLPHSWVTVNHLPAFSAIPSRLPRNRARLVLSGLACPHTHPNATTRISPDIPPSSTPRHRHLL